MTVFDQQFNAHAAPQLQQQFGARVLLVRPGATSGDAFLCPYSIVIDEVEIDEDALGTGAQRRTWWPLKSDCVLDGEQAEPRAGDVLRIVDASDQVLEEHEIAPHGSDRAVEGHPGFDHYVVRTKKTTCTTTTTTTTTTAAP